MLQALRLPASVRNRWDGVETQVLSGQADQQEREEDEEDGARRRRLAGRAHLERIHLSDMTYNSEPFVEGLVYHSLQLPKRGVLADVNTPGTRRPGAGETGRLQRGSGRGAVGWHAEKPRGKVRAPEVMGGRAPAGGPRGGARRATLRRGRGGGERAANQVLGRPQGGLGRGRMWGRQPKGLARRVGLPAKRPETKRQSILMK